MRLADDVRHTGVPEQVSSCLPGVVLHQLAGIVPLRYASYCETLTRLLDMHLYDSRTIYQQQNNMKQKSQDRACKYESSTDGCTAVSD